MNPAERRCKLFKDFKWRAPNFKPQNLQNARARLAALREKKPPTKAAQIRALWPDIKAALDAGHSLKSVCECLEADGIEINVPALGSYITRMRRKSASVVAPLAPASTESATRPSESVKRADAVPKRETSFDPVANVRERQGKRPGFDYRPELADPKELI